ncbi:nucleotidyltransferase domain-containing protein [Streptomyces griseoincarnatus]
MSRRSLPPPELRAYLEELVRRTSAVCGDRLLSVLAVGSLALGDYRHGRSDVDVTVVVDPAPPRPAPTSPRSPRRWPTRRCPAPPPASNWSSTPPTSPPARRARRATCSTSTPDPSCPNESVATRRTRPTSGMSSTVPSPTRPDSRCTACRRGR